MVNDFTFVITGKYDDAHTVMVSELKKYGKTILSTYKNDIDKINSDNYDAVVLSSEDEMISRGANPWYLSNAYQSLLVHRGMMLSTSKYTVRCRTDMWISNIEYLVDIIKKDNCEKLYVSNISWAIDKPYNIGDHITGGQTSIMQKTYREMYDACISGQFIYDGIDRYHSHEVNIFASSLKAKNKRVIEPEFLNSACKWIRYYSYGTFVFPIHSDTYNTLLTENFDLIDYRNLEPFYLRGKVTSVSEYQMNNLLPCYSSIEQYSLQGLLVPS